MRNKSGGLSEKVQGRRWPWRRLLLLLLALALLIWVGSTISLRDALATLTQLGPEDLLLLAGINLLVLSTFAGRWWLLLYTQGHRLPYWRLLSYRITAFAISYFTPGSHFGGEPYQIYAVSHWHRVPAPISIAAVTLDKLLEMLINFGVLVVGVLALLLMSGGLDPWVERQLAFYSLLLLAIPCSLLGALWLGRHPLTAVVRVASRFMRRPFAQSTWAQALRQSESQAIRLCREHPATVGLAFSVTLLTWVGVIGEFWLLTRMLGLSLTLLQAMTALVAARIAILLPLPAGLGALEASQVLAMESLGVDPSFGIAIAVVIRARDVVLGLVGLALGGAHLWQKAGAARSQWPTPTYETPVPEAPAPASDPQHSVSQP